MSRVSDTALRETRAPSMPAGVRTEPTHEPIRSPVCDRSKQPRWGFGPALNSASELAQPLVGQSPLGFSAEPLRALDVGDRSVITLLFHPSTRLVEHVQGSCGMTRPAVPVRIP